MKTAFQEYFRLSDDDYKDLWERALIVLDANVLLNFYRYPASVCESLYKVLGHVKERLWIPHQVAKEYLRERENVILKQASQYSDVIDDLNKVLTAFEHPRLHPHTSDDVIMKIKEVEDTLQKGCVDVGDLLKEDKVLSRLTALYPDDRVGADFSKDEIETVLKNASERYESKVPPGYEDHKKPIPDRYGDLFLWRQIIAQSKLVKQDVLLVTDDRKQDWRRFYNNDRVLGPRHELIKEFREETGRRFYMYAPNIFLERAKDFLHLDVEKQAIDELSDYHRAKRIEVK